MGHYGVTEAHALILPIFQTSCATPRRDFFLYRLAATCPRLCFVPHPLSIPLLLPHLLGSPSFCSLLSLLFFFGVCQETHDTKD